MTTLAFVLGGIWIFLLGATLGSFANVCIYRIALEKSIVWPGSRCPRCLEEIAFRDNIPIVGWVLLKGRCRTCGLPIAVRYPLIELLAGLLFVAVFAVDLVPSGNLEWRDFARLGYHLLLVSFLLVATSIDFDYTILPDSVTLTGLALGLSLGTLWPEARPAPNTATDAWGGLLVGLIGAAVGAGMIWVIRVLGELALRREAMGAGDVTLMALIGSFLGWQILPPTLFLASLLGLVQASYKLVKWIAKMLAGGKSRSTDRELPFGPYLSMAAVILMLGWPWLWRGRMEWFYANLASALRFLATGEG